jgi:cholesterol oxidase
MGLFGFPHADTDKTAVFPAMGRDRANGLIGLDPLTHDLKITWNTPSNLQLYQAERLAADIAHSMNGDPAVNPLWRLFRISASVHNLGGCPMAATADDGVTDPNGEV